MALLFPTAATSRLEFLPKRKEAPLDKAGLAALILARTRARMNTSSELYSTELETTALRTLNGSGSRTAAESIRIWFL